MKTYRTVISFMPAKNAGFMLRAGALDLLVAFIAPHNRVATLSNRLAQIAVIAERLPQRDYAMQREIIVGKLRVHRAAEQLFHIPSADIVAPVDAIYQHLKAFLRESELFEQRSGPCASVQARQTPRWIPETPVCTRMPPSGLSAVEHRREVQNHQSYIRPRVVDQDAKTRRIDGIGVRRGRRGKNIDSAVIPQ